MSELLKGVVEKIIQYCKKRRTGIEQIDFLLIIDDEEKVKIKSAFDVTAKIAELSETKKALSSVIVCDKNGKQPIVRIRFGNDGIWHLEGVNASKIL